jgi:flagellar biosynthesis chaperone FliJ
MGDRRGFVYALAPVQRKNEWDVNHATQDLASLLRKVDAQRQQAEQLARQYEAVRGEWARRSADGRLDLALQQLTYRYLAQLQEQSSGHRAQLRELEREAEQLTAHTRALRAFGDNLEEHRSQELRRHERAMAEQAYKDTDDIWLQRINWRKNP